MTKYHATFLYRASLRRRRKRGLAARAFNRQGPPDCPERAVDTRFRGLRRQGLEVEHIELQSSNGKTVAEWQRSGE